MARLRPWPGRFGGAAPVVAAAVSLLAHAALLFGVGAQPGQAGGLRTGTSGLTVRVDAPHQSAVPAARAVSPSPSPARARAAPSPQQVVPDARWVAHTPDDARAGPDDSLLPGLLAFDAGSYLPPSALERPATPLAEAGLDLLLLTGTQPGLWQVKLYIGADGTVDELEVLEARGDSGNTAELTAMLRTLRFVPALAGGTPVRSQKLLEFSFEPAPQVSELAPGLLAGGR